MRHRYYRPTVRRSLGDISLDPSSYIYGEIDRIRSTKCLADANASVPVKTIDEKTMDLAKNWHPTGFYSQAEVSSIITSILASNSQARAALVTAPRTTSDADQQINQAHAYLNRNEERALVYKNAITMAQKSGATAIDAPGLKDWVIKSMVNISQAYTTVAVLSCYDSWLYTAASVVTGIWNTAKRVVGLVIKAGDTLLKVADSAFDLVPFIKWGAIGLGVLFVAGKVRDYRRGR